MSTLARHLTIAPDTMSRIALGDRQAFQQLYDDCSGVLYGVILKILRQPSDAEDVLQEVFVKVWRSASSYMVEGGDPLPWLIRIARNAAIDGLRRQSAQGQGQTVSSDAEGPDGENLLAQMAHPDPGPLDLLSEAGDMAQIRHCMGQLQGSQRMSIAMAYYQGLSHPEIADHLREPLGTVKSWIRRGLQALRGCMERVAGGPAPSPSQADLER